MPDLQFLPLEYPHSDFMVVTSTTPVTPPLWELLASSQPHCPMNTLSTEAVAATCVSRQQSVSDKNQPCVTQEWLTACISMKHGVQKLRFSVAGTRETKPRTSTSRLRGQGGLEKAYAGAGGSAGQLDLAGSRKRRKGLSYRNIQIGAQIPTWPLASSRSWERHSIPQARPLHKGAL